MFSSDCLKRIEDFSGSQNQIRQFYTLDDNVPRLPQLINPFTPRSDQHEISHYIYQYIVKKTGDENNKNHQLRDTAMV